MPLWSGNKWGTLLWSESCPDTLRNKEPSGDPTRLNLSFWSLSQRSCTKGFPIQFAARSTSEEEVSLWGIGGAVFGDSILLRLATALLSVQLLKMDYASKWINNYSTLRPLRGDLVMLWKPRDMESGPISCLIYHLWVGKSWVIPSDSALYERKSEAFLHSLSTLDRGVLYFHAWAYCSFIQHSLFWGFLCTGYSGCWLSARRIHSWA